MNKKEITLFIEELALKRERTISIIDYGNVEKWKKSLKWIVGIKELAQLDKSSEVDFRLTASNLEHRAHYLPEDVSQKCLNLVSELGLNYGAIDLALMEDGSYVFFEINANGQWGWIEEKTNLPMRKALLNLLFM